MPICIGNKEYKDIFVGNKRIRRGYLGDVLNYQYDNFAPTLSVTAPTSTSSSSPTYYSTGTSYTVKGTVSDSDSGVKAVYVNGSAATISGTSWSIAITLAANTTTTVSVYAVDNAGNTTSTLTRYVRYDNVAPTLTVTAPTSISSSVPTTTTSSSYTVSGTVTDDIGEVESVTINGNTATLSGSSFSYSLALENNTTTAVTIVATDKSGNTTTTIRYVRRYSTSSSINFSEVYTYQNGGTASASTGSNSNFYGGYTSFTYGGFVIDLGSAKKISSVITIWPQYGGWGAAPGIGESITIYGSNSFNTSTAVTSQSWTQIGTGTISINYNQGDYTNTININTSTLYRYIRIAMCSAYTDANNTSYYWVRLDENSLKVYGG